MTAHPRKPPQIGQKPVHEGAPSVCHPGSSCIQILSRQLGISSLIGSYWAVSISHTKSMTQTVRIPDDPYAEGTPLTMAFGDQPKTLILASLLSEADRKIKLDDLSRLTGIEPSPLTGHLDDLHSDDLVIQSRNSDAELLYQINVEHPATEYMAKLEEAILDHWYEVEGGGQ